MGGTLFQDPADDLLDDWRHLLCVVDSETLVFLFFETLKNALTQFLKNPEDHLRRHPPQVLAQLKILSLCIVAQVRD